MSWRHFQYGLAYVRRKVARDQLAQYGSVLMTKASENERDTWRADVRAAAGYD